MDKLRMQTVNKADENFKKLAAMFPNAVTETINESGEVVRAIDTDVLMQEISCAVVDGNEERYQFTWPDKKKSVLLANAPINKTLRPCREESVDFDTTENLYIEGDNLEVLKLLQETYLGKIKMIYIDPPYNTGNDFVYEDDFAQSAEEYLANSGQFDEEGKRMVQNTESNGRFHTDWLNMIYPRLRLAKDLLTDDGFIAISIGEEESDNLRKVCDEIFGSHNFRNVVEVRRYDKNLNLQFAAEGLSTMNVGLEYIYIYSRNPFAKMTAVYKPSSDDRATIGYWKGFWNNADRPTMRYDILGVTPLEGQWKWKKEVADEAVKNYIEFEQNYSQKMSLEEYWISTGRCKRFIRRKADGSGKNFGVEHWVAPADGILRNSNWSDLLVSKPAGFGLSFDSPKNPEVLIELSKLFGIGGVDVVLDFFSGSATTAHAVMQLNAEDGGHRKFIMVQFPEATDEKGEANKAGYKTICEIGKERIRRAGAKIMEELKVKQLKETAPNLFSTTDNTDTAQAPTQICTERKGNQCSSVSREAGICAISGKSKSLLDVGFRVLKCDTSNMKDVYYNPSEYEASLFSSLEDNIKEDRTPEDLLFQVMLDLGVLLSSKIKETAIAGKKVFNVEDNYLIACFDSNVTEETIKAIAKQKPYYFVMRDSSLANDSVATNFDQIFATYSPDTIRKVL